MSRLFCSPLYPVLTCPVLRVASYHVMSRSRHVTLHRSWFTLISIMPLLLARSGMQSLVRRHYLGETQLPGTYKPDNKHTQTDHTLQTHIEYPTTNRPQM